MIAQTPDQPRPRVQATDAPAVSDVSADRLGSGRRDGRAGRGGRFIVFLGDVTGSSSPDVPHRHLGTDGQFLVDLPPGQARAWTFQAPAGYWAPGNTKSGETFVLSRSQPVHRKDYVVRRGTVWPFQLVRARATAPWPPGRETGPRPHSSGHRERALHARSRRDRPGEPDAPDRRGQGDGGGDQEKPLSRSLASIPIVIPLEWAEGFRAEAVKTIERVPDGIPSNG